jgi:hypothetical protein
MPVLGHQPRYRFGRGRTDALSPVNPPGQRPFHVSAVRGRHVRCRRGEATLAAVAGMAGNSLSPVHQHYCGCGDAYLERLPDQ